MLTQLRPHLTPDLLTTVYAEGHPQGLCFTATHDEHDRCLGVASWRIVATTLVVRKLYADDLVTSAAQRSRGVGRVLLAKLTQRARAAGCRLLGLGSGQAASGSAARTIERDLVPQGVRQRDALPVGFGGLFGDYVKVDRDVAADNEAAHSIGPLAATPKSRRSRLAWTWRGAIREPNRRMSVHPKTVGTRAARPEEAVQVVRMYEWLFEPPGFRPPNWHEERAVAACRRVLASDRATLLVAEVDRELAGLCSVYLDIESIRFGRRAWVEDLAVDPGRRSQGIGKLLLDHAKDWARTRGATHLELDSAETRSAAHRFYQRERPSWQSTCFGWQLQQDR